MKLQSKAMLAALVGALFLTASPAVQAAEKKSAKKSQYDLSSVPTVTAPNAASNAANSAAQSGVRTARDDASRKAKAKQVREQ